MPIDRKLLLYASALAAGLSAGCATTKVSPDALAGADDAIELARNAGARDRAPLELDEALSLRQQAQALADQKEGLAATRMAERAALQARLAIVRAEGAAARAELERERAELDALRRELEAEFGADFDAGGDS